MQKNIHLNTSNIISHNTACLRARKKQKYNIDVESFLFLPIAANVYWKNKNSVYIGCNDVLAEVVDLPSRNSIVKKDDYDIGVLEAIDFQQQDKIISVDGIPRHFYEPFTYGDRKIALSTLKMPLCDLEGNIVGIFGISCHLTEQNRKGTLQTLTETGLNIKNFQSHRIQNKTNKVNLSTRQTECLHYLTRGMTAKQIGKLLKISPRTVEDHIEQLKIKFNCSSKYELIKKVFNSK